MNWSDIGDTLLGLGLPTLGRALAGPGGEMAGSALAKALGAPATPDGLAKAVADPELQKKLAETDAEWARTAAAVANSNANQAQVINATMQAEIAQGQPWWAWRNLWGYSCVFEISATSLLILWELATGDFKAIEAYVRLSGFFMSWYGMRIGVLGFIYNGASNEKIAAATGEVPGVLAQIVKAFKK